MTMLIPTGQTANDRPSEAVTMRGGGVVRSHRAGESTVAGPAPGGGFVPSSLGSWNGAT